jgi:hypothetical protein
MTQTLLGALDDEEFFDKGLIVAWHIFEFKLILIILLEVLYALELHLHVLRSRGSALGGQVGQHFARVDLCDALDGEGPEYFLTDHHQDPAFVHLASVGDEGEWNLESAERFNIELGLGVV